MINKKKHPTTKFYSTTDKYIVMQKDTWFPIDIAPKDGTWILVYQKFEPYGFDKDEWDNDKWVARWAYDCWRISDEYTVVRPSHWMPLPKPPTQ